MTTRIAPSALLTLLMLISACSGSDNGSDASKGSHDDNRSRVVLVPLSDDVADALCGLTRHSSESDLIALLGEPIERKDASEMVLLRWKTDAWSADAMFSNGKLTLAGANARQPQKPKGNMLKDHPTWVSGKTQLSEMESQLGPGVRVGVQWLPGIEVARSIRNKPDFDDSITRDRCSDRYAWPNLNLGGFSSLRFSDGILQGTL